MRKSRPVSCFKRHYPHSFFPVFTRKHCCCLFGCLSVPAQSEVLSKFTLRRLHHPGAGPDLTQRRARAGSQGSMHSPGTRQHAAQPNSSQATSFPVGPWPLSGLALSPRLPLRLTSCSKFTCSLQSPSVLPSDPGGIQTWETFTKLLLLSCPLQGKDPE